MAIGTIPTVKICGLQSVEVLKSIVHLPIAHIGFVFAPSKRQVTPEKAAELIAYLNSAAANGQTIPLTVGVFVNPTKEQLSEILAVAPLDIVQLHSQETPAFCSWVREHLGVKVFKTVSINKTEDQAPKLADVEAQLNPYIGTVDAILLDTFDPIYGGGSGTTFAWDCIPVYQEWARTAGIQLLVAGGLHVDNVDQLVDAYAPDGVDVSSSVETDGVKDSAKITAFVERVTRK